MVIKLRAEPRQNSSFGSQGDAESGAGAHSQGPGACVWCYPRGWEGAGCLKLWEEKKKWHIWGEAREGWVILASFTVFLQCGHGPDCRHGRRHTCECSLTPALCPSVHRCSRKRENQDRGWSVWCSVAGGVSCGLSRPRVRPWRVPPNAVPFSKLAASPNLRSLTRKWKQYLPYRSARRPRREIKTQEYAKRSAPFLILNEY